SSRFSTNGGSSLSGATGPKPPKPPGPPPGLPPPGLPPPGRRPPGRASRSCSEPATVTKTLSPQTTGDDQPRPGTLAFQSTFLSAPHSAGSCLSVLTAVPPGPRNDGHSSPRPEPGSQARSPTRGTISRVRMC